MYTTLCHPTCRIASFAEKSCVWWCNNSSAITSSPLQCHIQSSCCHFCIAYEMQVRVCVRKSKNLRCIWTRLWRSEISPLISICLKIYDAFYYNGSRINQPFIIKKRQYYLFWSSLPFREECALKYCHFCCFQYVSLERRSQKEAQAKTNILLPFFPPWLRLLLGCYQEILVSHTSQMKFFTGLSVLTRLRFWWDHISFFSYCPTVVCFNSKLAVI